MHGDSFEAKLQAWSAKEPGVVAAAIVGSHARSAALAHSDIDVIILSSGHLCPV